MKAHSGSAAITGRRIPAMLLDLLIRFDAMLFIISIIDITNHIASKK
jgi:hypothetical protein